MQLYGLGDINDPKDAIGSVIQVKDNIEIVNSGKVGIITCLRDVGYPYEYGVQFVDGSEASITSRDFNMVVRLEAGKRYMLMSGHIVTIYEYRNCGGRFYFKYSEHWGAENPHTESIESNGFAYHYDCGCNVLKEVV